MKKLFSLITLAFLINLNLSLLAFADYNTPSNLTLITEGNPSNLQYILVNPDTSCPPNTTKFAQNSGGEFLCANFGDEQGSTKDFDGDEIINSLDKCPADFNENTNPESDDEESDEETQVVVDEDLVDEDFDGLYDGEGAGQCDAYDHLSHIIDAQNTALGSLASQANRINETHNSAVQNLGYCLPTNTASHPICNLSQANPQPDTKSFENLSRALQNESIIQMLDEPISNENIFYKARVCSTKFLKDTNGIIQPADRSNLYSTYNNLPSAFATTKFIITNNKCEDFFVETCTPSLNIDDSININDPLPVRTYCSTVQVLFADSGTDLLKVYVNLIYRWAAGIIGVIAVGVMIVNGILISASNGDSAKMESAKNRILQSVMGLALLFLSGILLYSINPNFFRPMDPAGKTPPASESTTDGTESDGSTDLPEDSGDFSLPTDSGEAVT